MVKSLDLAAYKRLLSIIQQERGPKALALAGLKPREILPQRGEKRASLQIITRLVDRWDQADDAALEDALEALIRACGPHIAPELTALKNRIFPNDIMELEEEVSLPTVVTDPTDDDEWDDATQALPRGVSLEDLIEAAADAEDWKDEHTQIVSGDLWSKLNDTPPPTKSGVKPSAYGVGESLSEAEVTGEGTVGYLMSSSDPNTLLGPSKGAASPKQVQSLHPEVSPPILKGVTYLPHRQRQDSGGLVELSFSGLPEGLHCLCLTGEGLADGGTIAFEGLQGERGTDFVLKHEAYFFFNMEELSPLLHRRVRFRSPGGLESPFLPIFVSDSGSSHSVIPETPQGAAWIPPGHYPLKLPSLADGQNFVCREGVFLAIHPVTHAEFERFLVATHYKPKNDQDYLRQRQEQRFPEMLIRHPVVYVSQEDARAYAQWVGGRLPTEEEWMRAAVGLEGRPFPWGDEMDHTLLNSREARAGWSTEVGMHQVGRGPFGHQDLLGNVWEWTRSQTTESSPPQSIIKGAAWVNRSCMATAETRSFALPQSRQFYIGFRVAWDQQNENTMSFIPQKAPPTR